MKQFQKLGEKAVTKTETLTRQLMKLFRVGGIGAPETSPIPFC
jgi:hypothetical protein